MRRHIGIIGAGMAGLSAAQSLRAAGVRATLFEKSRGLGGRMSTRRVDGLQFDHGAQYFTARGAAFKEQVAAWRSSGAAAPWFDDAYVGAPGMTAPARALGEGLDIVTASTATKLVRNGGLWRVEDAEGPIEAPGNGAFNALIVAVPAPQAQTLLASASVELSGVSAARYAPCWALMLAFEASHEHVASRIKLDEGAISWIARDSDKPGRGTACEKKSCETWVVHASPAWTREHIKLTPDEARAALLERFAVITGIEAEPVYASAHRWLYALVEQAAGAQCLWNADMQIGACGDWCIGPRVEAAFESGRAMAEMILSQGQNA
jgi:predicted NAD/FAD-dependent oxidoreductase